MAAASLHLPEVTVKVPEAERQVLLLPNSLAPLPPTPPRAKGPSQERSLGTERALDMKKPTAGYGRQLWRLGGVCTLVTRWRDGSRSSRAPTTGHKKSSIHATLEKGVQEEKQGRKGRRERGSDMNHGRMPP